MPLPTGFSRLSHFLRDVLPGLAHGPSLIHVLGSNRRVGVLSPAFPTEIAIDDGLTTIQFHDLTPRRIVAEVPDVLRGNADQDAPLLATIYAGRSGFLTMLGLVESVRAAHSGARFVILTCHCLTDDQEYFLRSGIDAGILSRVVVVPCGGSKSMGEIRDAVAQSRIKLPAHGHAAAMDADSPSLGA